MTDQPLDPMYGTQPTSDITNPMYPGYVSPQANPMFDMTNAGPVQTPSVRRSLDATVAQVSPALYAAGAVNGLTREEKNIIENWSQIQKTHRDLMSMSNVEADKKFKLLAPSWQAVLTQYYQTDYSKKPTNGVDTNTPWWKELLGTDKVSVGDLVKSPFRLLMQLGVSYGKVLNTAGNAIQNEVINKQSFMTSTNLKAAYDGKMLYDDKVASDLITKYGNATSYVAMHLLAGQTPGEIIDSWGPNDAEILKAVDVMFNDPKSFGEVVDNFKRAQLSPGRDIARWVNKTFNIDTEKHGSVFDMGSGALDVAYQIFMDPLTYLTFGAAPLIKGASKATKIADMLLKDGDVAGFLAGKGVTEYFTGYAEEIGKIAKARKAGNKEEEGRLVYNIENSRYSKYGSPEEVNHFVKAGIKDFDTFVNYFTNTTREDMSRLIRGLTTDMSYARNGAYQARRSRELVAGAKQTMSNLFKGTPDFNALDKVKDESLVGELLTNGQIHTKTQDFAQTDKIIEETTLKGIQRIFSKKAFEKATTIHPGARTIFVSEDKVDKTLHVFKAQAYLATADKAMAEVLTAHFLDSNVSERFAILRGIHQMIYRRAGLHGMNGGQEKINQMLAESFGTDGTFQVADALEAIPNSPMAQKFKITVRDVHGALHSYQIKDGIAAPSWRDVSHFIAKNSLDVKKNGVVESLPKLLGGLFNSKQADTLTSYWAWLTLIPQLGIRTAIDEGFFGLLYLNMGQMIDWQNGRRARNVWSAYTGDVKAIGPYKNAMQSLFKTGPTKLAEKKRDEIETHHMNLLAQGKHDSFWHAEQAARSDLIDFVVMSKYGKRLPENYKRYIREQALVDSSILRDTSAASLAHSDIATQGLWKAERLNISDDNMAKAIEAAGAIIGENYTLLDPRRMANSDTSLAMYRNFITRFNGRPFYTGGSRAMYTADAPAIFLRNNGLFARADWDNAVSQLMTRWGMIESKETGQWVVAQGKQGDINKLIDSTRHLEQYKNLPLDRGEILERYANDIFTDLYHTFHGGAKQFNDKLLKAFAPFTSKGATVASHNQILKALDFEDYSKLVENHLATDRIFTDIDFTGGSHHFEEVVRTKGMGKTFEWMARQSDSITRQPLVHLHYFSYRKQYATLETEYANKLFLGLKEQLGKDASEIEIKNARSRADEQAAHFFAERAMHDAANNVLKYVDNPEIRTVFSYNVRTVGRFYRAVEDFYRRLYRLSTEHGLGTIARMRLMNQGLSAVGAVHTDQNNEQYIILPMDNVIYSAVDNGLRALTGNNVSIKQPIFNNLTMKLTAGNPSFQTDAGVPYLSGPAGALSVLAVKGILGKFDATKNMAEDADNLFLGNMGDNVTFKKAVTPRLVNNLWQMLSPDEKSQQEVSALTQAISYNQANGIGIDPTSDKYLRPDGSRDDALLAKDKAEYLKNLRISAHNIIVTRGLLGLISPAAVGSMDNKDLPDYLKDVGITSMQASFYDIVDQVRKSYPDVQNPYELALATWTGNNPGKIAYLVSKKNKAIQPALSYSKQMQDWALSNSDAVKKYGAGALLFAPNIGKFDPGVWNWATAAGLTNNVDINDYFDRITMQQHINAYYDLAAQEASDLQHISLGLTDSRRAVTKSYEEKRRLIKLAVPGLEQAIGSGVDNTDAEQFIADAYAYANDKNADIPKDLAEKLITAHDIYINFIDYANQVDAAQMDNGSEVKRAEKERAIAMIENIIKSDSTRTIDQYFKYGLLKLMTAKSRDAAAGINRNVLP